ncbi:hypothetical protein D3C78_1558990 [compost metagenome]
MTVYGFDNFVATDFTGLYKIELSGYQVLSENSSGNFGNNELSATGSTIVDIEFNLGVATIPLTLFSNEKQLLTFRLVETNIIGKVEIQMVVVQPIDRDIEGGAGAEEAF